MNKQLRYSLKKLGSVTLFAFGLLIICGIIYPLVMTALSQLLFPYQANGSLITVHGKTVGSALLGQSFTDDRFMKNRPSGINYNTYTNEEKATGNYPGISSGSDNLAPSNPALKERVEKDLALFYKDHPEAQGSVIPGDLLTESASGLDPHISILSARIQIPMLSKTTGLSEAEIERFVDFSKESKTLGIFGEEGVNVLKVNLEIAKALNLL